MERRSGGAFMRPSLIIRAVAAERAFPIQTQAAFEQVREC